MTQQQFLIIQTRFLLKCGEHEVPTYASHVYQLQSLWPRFRLRHAPENEMSEGAKDI
jgi:hypothetical protein